MRQRDRIEVDIDLERPRHVGPVERVRIALQRRLRVLGLLVVGEDGLALAAHARTLHPVRRGREGRARVGLLAPGVAGSDRRGSGADRRAATRRRERAKETMRMGRKVYVDRRRHDEVREARLEGLGLSGHGEGGRREGARGRRHPVHRRRAGGRRLLLRRLDLRPARRLPARADRHPGLQRQQQLLDGLDGALHGEAVRRGRSRRLRARARLREDGEGLARRQVHRPHQPDGQAVRADGVAARLRGGAADGADLRQRRPRAHGEVRHHARAVREDRLQEPQALGEQPVLAVPGRVHARGDPGRADGLRAAHQAAVLPDVRRRRRPRSSPARTSSRSTASGRTRSRSPAWR